jgi:hypothetical protein
MASTNATSYGAQSRRTAATPGSEYDPEDATSRGMPTPVAGDDDDGNGGAGGGGDFEGDYDSSEVRKQQQQQLFFCCGKECALGSSSKDEG